MDEFSDPATLAGLARDLLAAASEATLLLSGPVKATEPASLLPDKDGSPHLWCERGSGVAAAARLQLPAVFTVTSRRHMGAPVVLAVAGRLRHVAAHDQAGRLVDVVAMLPARVAVDVGREPHVRSHIVPLDAYARATPDPIVTFAARTIAHTNVAHATDLRRYVSARFDLPEPVIAGAMLARLDRHGATLRWVDAVGAHATIVEFDRPATCPSDLAALLSTHLTTASTI